MSEPTYIDVMGRRWKLGDPVLHHGRAYRLTGFGTGLHGAQTVELSDSRGKSARCYVYAAEPLRGGAHDPANH